jgi:hypothetical protein
MTLLLGFVSRENLGGNSSFGSSESIAIDVGEIKAITLQDLEIT